MKANRIKTGILSAIGVSSLGALTYLLRKSAKRPAAPLPPPRPRITKEAMIVRGLKYGMIDPDISTKNYHTLTKPLSEKRKRDLALLLGHKL